MSDLFDDIGEFLKKPQPKITALSEDETEKLMIAFIRKRGETEVSEEEVIQVVRWGEKARIDGALLDLVLKGYAAVDLQKGQLVFSITDTGREAVKRGLIDDSI